MRKKFTVILLSLIVLIILAVLAFTAVSIYNYGNNDYKQKADVAVVLGASATEDGVSQVYRERINHAIWLYENGYVEYILTTGGVSEGNMRSDAEIAKEYIVEYGIPEGDVFTEDKSAITEENLRYAKEIMEQERLDSCIIVSDPLHMKRSMLMAEDLDLEAYSSPTPTTRYQSFKTKIPFLIREEFFYLGYCILRPFR